MSGADAAAEPLVLRLLLAAAEERAPAEEGPGLTLSEKQRQGLESWRRARSSTGVLARGRRAAPRTWRRCCPRSARSRRGRRCRCCCGCPAETKLALVRLMHAAPPLPPAQLLLELHLLELEEPGLVADVAPEKLRAHPIPYP